MKREEERVEKFLGKGGGGGRNFGGDEDHGEGRFVGRDGAIEERQAQLTSKNRHQKSMKRKKGKISPWGGAALQTEQTLEKRIFLKV